MLNLFNTIPSIGVGDITEKIKADNVGFVDVRSKLEFQSGHARGAKNIPLETIVSHVEELKKYDSVYVICRSGGRSAQAVRILIAEGVHASNVSGGTNAWQSAGLPVD